MVQDATTDVQVVLTQLKELIQYTERYQFHQIQLECELLLCGEVHLKRLKDVPTAIINIAEIMVKL